ncbi:hypothetical protein [Spongiibacter sp. UBA1325]|uniref:hypothetical protein n=1 Tax=Spongiibacter sp. UBA1325 TaxID=1947543 RepID=UPI002580B284|nr:hypothetical protein [Spongiibacter sp. UBA1325]
MSLKDQAVNLILRAKNLLSGDTDSAAKSLDGLSNSAERLQGELRELEDNTALVKEFGAAEKAVDRTSAAYDRARLRADKLADKLDKVGAPTRRQAQEFEAAQKAVDAAEREYQRAEKTLAELGEEAQEAGINLEDLNGEQRRMAARAKEARRELEDLGNETEKADGRFLSFRKNLSNGIITFGKWAAAATAAGVALTVGALTRFTASQADLARQTLASADAFGISAEKLQEWQYAAERAGIDSEKTADLMKDVADKIGDAFLNGGGEAIEVIEGLNLDIEKLVRLKPDEQILAIAERLNGLPKAGQIQILESLANDASLLLPLLENNAEKLRELSEEAQQRNAIFTEDELKALADVDSGFRKILASVKGFGNELAIRLAPAFSSLAETIDQALTDKPKLVEDISGAFVTLIEKVEQFTKAIVSDGSGITATLSTIANTASGLGNTFKAVFRGVQSSVAGALEVVARSAYSLQNIVVQTTRGLSAVGLATDESLAKAEAKLAVIGESVKDLQSQSEKYKREMIEAGKAAADAFTRARDGAVETAKVTASAAAEMVGLGSATERAAKATEKFSSDREKLIAKEGELGAAIEMTAQALDELGAAIANNPTQEQLEELEALNTQYAQQQLQLRAVREELEQLDRPVNISVSTNIEAIADQYREASGAIEEATQSVSDFSEKVGEAGDRAQATGEKAQSMGSAIADFYNNITARLSDLSQKALAAFEALTGGSGEALTELDAMKARVKALGEGIRALGQSGVVAGSRLTKWFIDTAKASNTVERQFLKQKIALEEVVNQFERGEYQSRYLNSSLSDLERQFNLLDDQDLNRLQGAIERVQSEVDGLNDSLQDTISSLRQELASLEGDSEEVERLRYQEQRLELEAQLQRARSMGDREAITSAQEALNLAKQAYNLRLQQARQRSEEEAQRAAEQAAAKEQRRQQAEAEQRERQAQDFAREDRQAQSQSQRPTQTIILQGPDGTRVPVTTDNPDDLLSVLESLGRRVS